ncbi:uncharacterized protein LOC103944976 isoform X3 [Pyrus x bretschneideri]|uniref:uncharacterized protein LOC103944976 isoform X3 n=1 Tax=Pyrus x bretschneideri TaxID=225117 RepID=UPI00202FD080|nr:uncharacterized protein LOC103944976 isoform X3 [Pyrus x bretschneideri]
MLCRGKASGRVVMEELLGYTEESRDNEELGISKSSSSSPYSYKLVPWLSWDEWLFVEKSLFSNSPDFVASALRRISTWRSRGCLPITIEVTASIIEIQRKDPHFRTDQSLDASLSEEMLAMLYCMAIMRLVNGVVEKTRKKTEVSIAVAADAIGIPRTLIDVRHEGSHRELPALDVVRTASVKALDWLKCYYWEPQKKEIPFHGNETDNIRIEIRSKLHELAFSLRVKTTPQSHSSNVKKKRGLKKDRKRILKSLIGLYSSFSSEVVSVLLEFLLEAINSSDSSELPVNIQSGPRLLISLNEWKLVITKFSNKEPELLLALLNAVLDMIETRETVIYETGGGISTSSGRRAEVLQVEHLSSLFAWLVQNFEGLKPRHEMDSAAEIKVSSAEKTISKAILMELLRKCLIVSASANKKLTDSAAHLAQLAGDSCLVGKLHKLSSFVSSNSDGTEEDTVHINSNNQFKKQEESISQAAEKLELIKRRIVKSKVAKRIDADVGDTDRWVLAKSWNPCPIGMLPRAVGSSGRLPVLDVNVPEKVPELLGRKEKWELNQCSVKRPSSDMQLLDNPCVKKMRAAVDGSASEGEDVSSWEDVDGHLMIGGVWKKVGEEELLAIKSAVRILI